MNCTRTRVLIRGAVQGVGFRPFVYRLATELGLTGWVSNSVEGVLLEAEGAEEKLQGFLARLESEKPSLAVILNIQSNSLPPAAYDQFEIHDSDCAGATTALILPDIATCDDCLGELFDPDNRR